MSVHLDVDDVEIDADANAAVATVELEIEDLFNDDGELRLWQDSEGLDGFLLEDGTFYSVNVLFGEPPESWPRKIRCADRHVLSRHLLPVVVVVVADGYVGHTRGLRPSVQLL